MTKKKPSRQSASASPDHLVFVEATSLPPSSVEPLTEMSSFSYPPNEPLTIFTDIENHPVEVETHPSPMRTCKGKRSLTSSPETTPDCLIPEVALSRTRRRLRKANENARKVQPDIISPFTDITNVLGNAMGPKAPVYHINGNPLSIEESHIDGSIYGTISPVIQPRQHCILPTESPRVSPGRHKYFSNVDNTITGICSTPPQLHRTTADANEATTSAFPHGQDETGNNESGDEETNYSDSMSEYWHNGLPTSVCQHCEAVLWYDERKQKLYKAKNPKFNLCCSHGRVILPHYTDPPEPIKQLFHGTDRRSKFFQENIRSFNSMFSFTSMGGKIQRQVNVGGAPPVFVLNGENYHQIGSLMPLPGDHPKFAQLYVYDTENEISNRMSVVSMVDDTSHLQSSIVKEIRDTLDISNPYVHTYRFVRERLMFLPPQPIKLRLIGKRDRDPRRYNLPTASEVAGLIVGDFDSAHCDRDIIVETQSGFLKRISTLSSTYLPLQYPLFFPRGEDGWWENIEYNEASTAPPIKREKVTLREWFAYRFQQRTSECSIMLYGRRLFQQILVDGYTMIESQRLHWVRSHQTEIRADMYKGLSDALLRGDLNPSMVGKRIVLPSSFTGGSRYMQQNYQDAMAICRWSGYPDLFITFTCNPKWPELTTYLASLNLKSEDRPDLVARLFKIKLDHFIREIKKGQIFGKTKAVIYTIEFQKRGLPHAHILVFLQPNSRIVVASDIDRIISAEIPNQITDPELFSVVSNFMIHGPCGAQRESSPCMVNDKCSKYFPKKFVDSTTIDDDGYPIYRRRDDGVVIKKGESFVDNRYVVPYNKKLLLQFNAHINVEWCNQSRSIKYLFKYVNKGHDRVTATFYESAVDGVPNVEIDEIRQFYDCRYLSSCEAVWRIFSFDIHHRDPSVERLMFHLPGENYVIFNNYQTLDEILHRTSSNFTKFMAWFVANRRYPQARKLTYPEFPTKFVWNQKDRSWSPRKKGFSIGRMHFVPPGTGEIYYMRTLLNYVRGPTCYEDLRTVNSHVHPNFKDACYAMGFLEDDKEYIDAFKEASHWGSANFLRHLFTTLLVANAMSRAEFVFEQTCNILGEDILFIQRSVLRAPGLTLTDQQIRAYVLIDINRKLQAHNKRLTDYPSMPSIDDDQSSHQYNTLISDELNYDRIALAEEHTRLLSTMTAEQRVVYDTIMYAVLNDKGGFFFLNAFGGAGKTYIWRALSAGLRSKGEIVLTVASCGVAALLMPGGRTAHSRFAIPLNIHEDSTCNIAQGSHLAELISRAKLIIWDEAPMMHKHCFEAVDRTLKDILRPHNRRNGCQPFGGKVTVLGGDFRQILPVIPKGTRQQIVNSTINASYLWSQCHVMTLTTNMRLLSGSSNTNIYAQKHFSEWILAVGDGKVGIVEDDVSQIELPEDLILHSTGDPLADIVKSTYPDFLAEGDHSTYYQDRAILAPKNDVVDQINAYMASQLPTSEMTYYSLDTPHSDNFQSDRHDNVHSTEYLNSISSPGLPNHILHLKVGVPVMLLRNIDQNAGLCNGTRLIVTRLGKFVIEGKLISGNNVGHKVYICRLSLTPSDVRIPFKFQRRQFPLALSFAMTINKSQGQSVKQVGLYLPTPAFSHGQLYVAFSRVTSKQGLKILITNEAGESSIHTSNVVYPEVFTNLR